MKISILIPCYNEEKTIKHCIKACLNQTRKADQIVVVDDGSTDNSPRLIRIFRKQINIVRIDKNVGNKSYAQEYGLQFVKGDIFISTDSDTIMHERFVENIERDFQDKSVIAVGGYVKSMKYNWLTALRELDYILGQNIHKVAQSYINSLFVIPGCAGAFRTAIFKKHITFDHDTVTEDLDFTYKLNRKRFRIFYDREAIVYTQDPMNIKSYIKQMSRWHGGGWQNLMKHSRIFSKSANALELSLIYIEGLVFSTLLFLIPIINIHFFIRFIMLFLIFSTILGIYGSIIRRRIDLLFYSPLYIIVLFTSATVFLVECVREVVLKKQSLVWFKPERRVIS